MKAAAAARAGCVALGLALLALPELYRYDAERDLRRAEAALRGVAARSSEVTAARRATVLDEAAEVGSEAARWLPAFRDGLEHGERPELLLGAGRELAALGRIEEANEAALRAAWLAPALFWRVDEPSPPPLRARVEEMRLSLERREPGAHAPPAPAWLVSQRRD
jgi:hypothetical protein